VLSSPGQPAVIGTPNVQTVTIIDDDGAGKANFSARAYRFDENEGTVPITITRNGATVGALDVRYFITPGTATPGADYNAVDGMVTFAPGETTKTFTIDIIDDLISELTETVNLRLETDRPANQGAVINATISIVDNDTPATIQYSSGNYTVLENEGVLTVTVARTGSLVNAVAVSYAADPGTASVADFTPVSGILNFPAGVGVATFDIPITNDTIVEGRETILLVLRNPTQDFAVLGTNSTAIVTINDNDSSYQFSAPAYFIARDAGPLLVTVTRTGNTEGTNTVSYTTTNGTAVAGIDYTAAAGTLTFTPGQTSQSISIPILDNAAVTEPNVSFTIALSNVTGDGAMLGPNSTATVNIGGGPHVTAVKLLSAAGRINRIERVELTFAGALDPATAKSVGNYILTSRRADGRFNVPVRLSDAVYDPTTNKVTLFPRTPLKINQFYQLSLNTLGNLKDVVGNGVVQGLRGSMGGTLVSLFGRGSTLKYVDGDGDLVTLKLKRGVMELMAGPDGTDPVINIMTKVPGKSVLSGTVKTPKKVAANGTTRIAAITNMSGVLSTLTNPPFIVASIT
jgi:hypothetical protein